MSSRTRIKVLFVCGRNLRRSPTAEAIFRDDARMMARSAGTAESSRHRITAGDLAWADLVLVMERKYAGRIRALFTEVGLLPPMESLDIEDEYEFMDEELVGYLQSAVEGALEEYRERREER